MKMICKIACAFVFGGPAVAHALIDLDFRPDWQARRPGQTVAIQLYAVSDNNQNQLLSAMDVVIRWDPTKVNPISFTNAGNGYNWLSSGFFAGSINNRLDDGDAMWTAWARPGQPAAATPEGLLVTTFLFTAQSITISTVVEIVPSFNGFQTVVFDGTIPNTPVTGRLDDAEVMILPWIPTPPPTSVNDGLVPEPAGVGLFVAGLAWLACRRRR